MKAITVRVEDDLNEWLSDNFPHGFKQMFLEETLKSLKGLVEGSQILTIKEQALVSAISAVQAVQREEE